MGSFFLPDDYRLSDLDAPFKKDTSNGGQGIFEHNVCFDNIKRSLGFGLDDMATSTSNAASGAEDDWTYTRARASPVVERLILQEIQNDIAEYAAAIGVSMDPMQWSVDDTRKWLRWVEELYQIADLTSCLSFDGRTLCQFSERDFVLITGTEDSGLKITAQLDLWKNAIRMTPSSSSHHFQQQQAMDHKLGTVMGRQDNNTPKLLDAGCLWPPASQQPTFSAPPNVSTNNQMFNGANNGTVVNNGVNASNTGNYQELRSNSFQPYNPHTPISFLNEPPQGRCAPRPTIPLDRFRSVREACQDNGFLTWEKYQEFTSITPSRNSQNMMFLSSSDKCNNVQAMRRAPAPAPSYTDTNIPDMKKEIPEASSAADTPPVPDIELPILSDVDGTDAQTAFDTQIPMELKTEKVEECTEMETTTTKVVNERGPKKKSTKHPIHLWEFLKQMLHDGKDCIRWIDQDKGIFKIYNSQEVAKFWGERKNRPAMNYDKLSRSIRQYYKKGIIKKTIQGKRLVYQFCEGYH